MIGYLISRKDLETLIEKESPGWLQRAAKRTEGFKQLGHYEESNTIWSEVKSVYMKLQGESKCAYCERKLESIPYGKGEQDVEHFRPKKQVREWKVPKELTDQEITATKVPTKSGYYLLSYHLFNYMAACKPCNSAIKKGYFPIESNYKLAGEEPSKMLDEKPFLIYPIGDFDEDPENLIRFHGVSPQAVENSGYKRARALVTIEFFHLDNVEKRRNLIEERARIIIILYPQLEKITSGVSDAELASAQAIIVKSTSPKAPHTNCARSFKRLYENDPGEAEAIFNKSVVLIDSSS